ncbi:MAG: Hsp20/alpha crystallin family protein [Pirellulaceae bacterium]
MAGLIPLRGRKSEARGGVGISEFPRSMPALMRRMQEDFEAMLGTLSRWPGEGAATNGNWTWGMEVDEQPDRILVRAEAPGFELEDFDLRINHNRLTIHACRKSKETGEESESTEECECYETLVIPDGVDREKVQAVYRNGVLTVTLPKTKEGIGKKIAVTGG